MKKLILPVCIFLSFALSAQVVETDSLPNKNNPEEDRHLSIHGTSPNGGESFDKSKHLTGNWGGAREVWIANGVDPYVIYAAIAGSNVSGGVEQASAYGGQVLAGIKFDFDRLVGWKGFKAKVSMANRHGKGLLAEVGSVYNPITVVGGQTTFLVDLSVEKNFGDQVSLKAGRVTAADDFSTSPLYKFSLSNAINGPIRPLLLDRLMSTFPFAVWGARLKYQPSSRHRFQLGTYQFSRGTFDATRHGLDFAFRDSDDFSLFLQYDWFGKVADRNARFYLGVHQVFGSIPNLGTVNESNYFIRFYGHVDVELMEGLRSFLILSYANQGEIARLPFQISIGHIWKGLIKSRPKDSAVFFASYGNFSDEFAITQGDVLSSEVVLELGYRFQITDYLLLQPALQYDIQPSGSGDIENAFIPGVAFVANF